MRHTRREVRFISELIDRLQSQYNIDSNRIYANGMSNGGGMAFALSCKLSDRIAAVKTVAAELALPWDRCGYSKPVPTIVFHATADKFAPYQGGKSPITPRPLANVPDWAADVAQRTQCKAGPIDTRVSPSVRRLAYTNCAEKADVVLYSIEGEAIPGRAANTWRNGSPGARPTKSMRRA